MVFAGIFNREHGRKNMTAQSTLTDSIESTIASLPAHMQDWVDRKLPCASRIKWEIITGKADQIIRLENELEASGAYTRLDEDVYGKRTFYARSDKNDVARVEERTVICTEDPVDAGPLNFWVKPDEMHAKLDKIYDGVMKGRTMYVMPFVTNPADSQFATAGVQLTDSANVVCNLFRMSNIKDGWRILEKQTRFPRICHSYGTAQQRGSVDHALSQPNSIPAPSTATTAGTHWGPRRSSVCGWSAFRRLENAAKKNPRPRSWTSASSWSSTWPCSASTMADRRVHFGAAFPSMCGKTNIATGVYGRDPSPRLAKQCFTLGDDIIGGATKKGDGRLYVNNIEAGMFGVTKGMSDFANKMLMEALRDPQMPEVQDFEGGPIFTNQVLVDNNGSQASLVERQRRRFPRRRRHHHLELASAIRSTPPPRRWIRRTPASRMPIRNGAES